MSDGYSLLRTKFRDIIESNLSSDFCLSAMDLYPHRKNIEDADSLTFHKYFRADYRSIRNIETDVLALVNPIKFNDVFEGIPSFTDDADLKRSDIIRDSAVITCFCEEANNLLMFAHYADSFTGMCVQYNFNLLSASKNIVCNNLYPVLYESNPSKLKGIDGFAKMINKYYSELMDGKVNIYELSDIISFFIHKPNVWDYEKEWRIILPTGISDGTKKNVHLIKNFDCITKIYLGYKMDKDVQEHILEIISRKNEKRLSSNKIEVFKTSISGDSYTLTTTSCNV